MVNKLIYRVFLAVFLVLCLTLSVGVAIWGPSHAGANERLSADARLFDKDGKFNPDYLSDLASWMSDHFFGRQELISTHNYLTGAVFGHSGTDSVILGKDGWLYFADTLVDYTGSDHLTDREIAAAARNLYLIQEYCETNAMEFQFVLAPNKNSLYPEYMPDFGARNENSNAQRLYEKLRELNVAYIDMHEAFREQDEILYFAHDSHWNSKGAALGADLVNFAFGKESDYFSDAFAQSEPHDGDLYEMAYPTFRDPEQNPVYGGTLNFTYEGNATKPDSITLNTLGTGEGNLLAFRDSFGNLLHTYLADSFASSRFSRATAYDLVQTEELETDYVLIELVERNISYLIRNLPVMPAPQREQKLPDKVSGTASVTVKEVKKPAGMVKITGTLPEEVESPVYLICDGVTYEAFRQADGFGAYAPEPAEKIVYFIGGEPQVFAIS